MSAQRGDLPPRFGVAAPSGGKSGSVSPAPACKTPCVSVFLSHLATVHAGVACVNVGLLQEACISSKRALHVLFRRARLDARSFSIVQSGLKVQHVSDQLYR